MGSHSLENNNHWNALDENLWSYGDACFSIDWNLCQIRVGPWLFYCFKQGTLTLFKVRVPWLLAMSVLISESTIIFEDVISQYFFLGQVQIKSHFRLMWVYYKCVFSYWSDLPRFLTWLDDAIRCVAALVGQASTFFNVIGLPQTVGSSIGPRSNLLRFHWKQKNSCG